MNVKRIAASAVAAALLLRAATPFCAAAALPPMPFDPYFEAPVSGLFPRAGAYAAPLLGELTVTPANGLREVPAGTWLVFDVTRGGAALSPSEYTVEVVGGKDIAQGYASGEIVCFGAGEVVVRVFLDADPSVDGYGAVTVSEARDDVYELFTEKSAAASGTADAAFEQSVVGFPESYKPYLRALHEKYPAWVFEPFYTGLDFFGAVESEDTGEHMLTLKLNFADVYKSKTAGDYDRAAGQYIVKDPGWVAVNGTAISWFMDPRNMLDERYIFQFELLTYDPDVHGLAGVEAILNGTFMHEAACDYLDENGNTVSSGTTYGEAILSAARELDVSPYFIASKIRGEIGTTPTDSVSGALAGYEGIYNFYNIGASDGEGNIERGLAWAAAGESYNRPWTSPGKSIYGGAQFLAEEYIGAGQYTGYLQKFNVNADSEWGLYQNQYMTNVSGAAGIGASAAKGYAEAGALSSPVVFSVPVYENMPGENARVTSFDVGAAGVVNSAVALRAGAVTMPLEEVAPDEGDTDFPVEGAR